MWGRNSLPSTFKMRRKLNSPPYDSNPKAAGSDIYLINNGYTIRVDYHDAPGTGDLLSVGDKPYQFIQFHFHRPSKEYISGKQYDMVAHLMHRTDEAKWAPYLSQKSGTRC